MTASARSSAWRNVDAMRSKLSPTLVWKMRVDAGQGQLLPIHDELVSTIWPSSSSVPTATTSQRIGAATPYAAGATGAVRPVPSVVAARRAVEDVLSAALQTVRTTATQSTRSAGHADVGERRQQREPDGERLHDGLDLGARPGRDGQAAATPVDAVQR